MKNKKLTAWAVEIETVIDSGEYGYDFPTHFFETEEAATEFAMQQKYKSYRIGQVPITESDDGYGFDIELP